MAWTPGGLSSTDYLKVSNFTPQEQVQADILSFGYKYSKLTPQQLQDIQIAQAIASGDLQVADTIKINPNGVIVPSNPIGDSTWGKLKPGQTGQNWYNEQFKKVFTEDPIIKNIKDDINKIEDLGKKVLGIPADVYNFIDNFKYPLGILALIIIYKMLF